MSQKPETRPFKFDTARLGPIPLKAVLTPTDRRCLTPPRLAFTYPPPHCRCACWKSKNEQYDIIHRRATHALQLDVRLLPQYERDEPQGCLS
jgi:hypothetical protein